MSTRKRSDDDFAREILAELPISIDRAALSLIQEGLRGVVLLPTGSVTRARNVSLVRIGDPPEPDELDRDLATLRRQ